MAEKRSGAGAHLSGVLERSSPPLRPTPEADEPEVQAVETPEADEPAGKGARAPRKSAVVARQAKRIKGRTIYMPDDLFERLLIQSHRRDMTISDYVVMVLGRNVPDHQGKGRAGDDAA